MVVVVVDVILCWNSPTTWGLGGGRPLNLCHCASGPWPSIQQHLGYSWGNGEGSQWKRLLPAARHVLCCHVLLCLLLVGLLWGEQGFQAPQYRRKLKGGAISGLTVWTQVLNMGTCLKCCLCPLQLRGPHGIY